MTPEELKVQIEQVKQAMDASITSTVEAMKGASTKDREALKAEFNTQFTTLNDTLKKLNERLDTIETKAQRFDANEKKSVNLQVKELIQKSNELNAFKAKNATKAGIVLPYNMFYKADDMTQANSFESTVVVPVDQRPGIYYNPDTAFRVRNLLAQGTTMSNNVTHIREYAYSDGSGIKTEGSASTQSDFDLKRFDAAVYAIGAHIIISEEMLDDVDGLTSYIMSRLPSKLSVKENNQLLYGTGSSEISGLSTNATAYSDALADSNVTLIDVLADAVRQVKDDEYSPTAILMHPANVTTYLTLKKDSTYNYLAPWVFTGENPSIAGVPVIQTTAITSGTFFVGDFARAAQVFDRKQSMIEFSNSNEDNFLKGMVTVRATERLALAIYRPSAFIYGSIAAALAQGTA